MSFCRNCRPADQYVGHSVVRGWVAATLLVVLSFGSAIAANSLDRSDLNGDGLVDDLDLATLSNLYLEEPYQAVDWCAFYERSTYDSKYFRGITSDRVENYQALFDYIVASYGCEVVQSANSDKSDLNVDGFVDLADLVLFSADYLGMDWETVDWCAFYDATLAGEDFNGIKTGFYLAHFQQLLAFINLFYRCDAPPPPPNPILLESTPRAPYRVISRFGDADFFVSDPTVGSIFIYGPDLVPKNEIKGLNRPLGIAMDSQGLLLVGNSGRYNVEVYNPANGDLVAVFGENVVRMPNAITVDDLGDIYVADSERHVVWVFSPTYQLVRWIGNPGEGQQDLRFPIDVEVHLPTQQVFVADQGNNRVQVYDLQGKWLRSIVWNGSGCSWWTGVCSVPKFMGLQALDIDSLGRLHVLDRFGGAVITFDVVTGARVANYGGYGTEPGQLKLPTDVLVLPSGTSIVPSGNGSRIETFTTP